jgi:hypothetical protein
VARGALCHHHDRRRRRRRGGSHHVDGERLAWRVGRARRGDGDPRDADCCWSARLGDCLHCHHAWLRGPGSCFSVLRRDRLDDAARGREDLDNRGSARRTRRWRGGGSCTDGGGGYGYGHGRSDAGRTQHPHARRLDGHGSGSGSGSRSASGAYGRCGRRVRGSLAAAAAVLLLLEAAKVLRRWHGERTGHCRWKPAPSWALSRATPRMGAASRKSTGGAPYGRNMLAVSSCNLELPNIQSKISVLLPSRLTVRRSRRSPATPPRLHRVRDRESS